MREFLTYAFYPLSLVAALTAGITLLQAGVSPMIAVSCIGLFFIALCFILELRYPQYPDWHYDNQELRSDLLHAAISNTIPTELFRLAFYTLIVGLAQQLDGALGYSLWPHDAPVLLQLALALLVVEFVSYWVHRTLHSVSFLWPLHAVHHCSRNYYCMIGLRKHPVQSFITYGLRLSALWLIGTPADILALYSILAGANSMMQHSNFHMNTGPLSWVFATPEIHRWHHSKLPAESNRNYGDILIIWDVLFGTRILPADMPRLHEQGLGLPDGTRVNNSYWGHLKMPFEWSRIQPDR